MISKILRHITKKKKVQLGVLFLISILSSIAEIVSVGSIIPLLGMLSNSMGNKIDISILKNIGYGEGGIESSVVVFLFIMAAILSGITRIIYTIMQSKIAHEIGVDFSLKMYSQTLSRPYIWHIAQNSSEITTGINLKVANIVQNMIIPVLTITNTIVIGIGIVSLLLLVSYTVTIVALTSILIVYGLIALFVRQKLDSFAKILNTEQTAVFKTMQEGLGSIQDVIIDGTQQVFYEKYKKSEVPLRKAIAGVQIYTATPRFAIEAISMSIMAAIALYFSKTTSDIAVITVLGAVALAAQRLLPLLQQAYVSWSCIQAGKEAVREALKFIELDPRELKIAKVETNKIEFKKEITLENVSFKYPGVERKQLKNIHLTINKGDRIGIVGETGQGKSTLINIILGLLDPTEGRVIIDEQELNTENIQAYQKNIAHVPQNIYLTDGSILENIALGEEIKIIDKDRVVTAAKLACVDESIKNMIQGYATIVGERGVRLSGGQKQRIGIARALYKNASILVFDEATSALDGKTESKIIEEIFKFNKDMTIIMIAHRLSSLRSCNKIIEVKDSRLKVIDIKEFQSIVALKN